MSRLLPTAMTIVTWTAEPPSASRANNWTSRSFGKLWDRDALHSA